MITPDDVLLHMLQTGQITLTEYLKTQELPSETINRLRKAVDKYKTNKKKK